MRVLLARGERSLRGLGEQAQGIKGEGVTTSEFFLMIVSFGVGYFVGFGMCFLMTLRRSE
jgi:hypothetical protein